MKKIRLVRLIAWICDFLYSSNKIRSKQIDPSEEPFFIISAGRSGSTLLNRILNEHEQLFLPSEQYFLGESILKYRIYKFLVWRDLVKVILGELMPSIPSHSWNFNPDPLFKKMIPLKGDQRNLRSIIDGIFIECGNQSGRRSFKWGDSTPLNSHYINEVFFLFPKARYIFLIRDGRDVVTSYSKNENPSFGHLSVPENAVKYWNKSIQAYRFLQRKKANLIVVKYESLVNDPTGEVTRIARFLGVEPTPKMYSYHRNIPPDNFYNEEYRQKIKLPLTNKYIGSFRENYSVETSVKLFKPMEKNLRKFGYTELETY